MVLEKIAVLKELTIFSVLLRTVLAMVFSGILGYEREKKGVRQDFGRIWLSVSARKLR